MNARIEQLTVRRASGEVDDTVTVWRRAEVEERRVHTQSGATPRRRTAQGLVPDRASARRPPRTGHTLGTIRLEVDEDEPMSEASPSHRSPVSTGSTISVASDQDAPLPPERGNSGSSFDPPSDASTVMDGGRVTATVRVTRQMARRRGRVEDAGRAEASNEADSD